MPLFKAGLDAACKAAVKVKKARMDMSSETIVTKAISKFSKAIPAIAVLHEGALPTFLFADIEVNDKTAKRLEPSTIRIPLADLEINGERLTTKRPKVTITIKRECSTRIKLRALCKRFAGSGFAPTVRLTIPRHILNGLACSRKDRAVNERIAERDKLLAAIKTAEDALKVFDTETAEWAKNVTSLTAAVLTSKNLATKVAIDVFKPC